MKVWNWSESVYYFFQWQGCYESLVELINNNMSVIAAASIGVAFFPIIGIALACCLAANINKTKYEQMT